MARDNRQCGDCRYYESSSLERLGWCRHPKIGDNKRLVNNRKLECGHHYPTWWEPREEKEQNG